MPWSQQGGADEPEMNISVPQQEGQADATRGEVKVDYSLHVDYKPEGSKSKQSLKKRRTLMQNMQKWSYLEMGHHIKGG